MSVTAAIFRRGGPKKEGGPGLEHGVEEETAELQSKLEELAQMWAAPREG